ncbi:hypothetical protein KFK09_026799 [Dendrobium nobile]|uniref:eIF-4F 25 kDa subunit n=1 Tax=Dendrobium nobile TaxID=94219 RepID=A0A8T3A7K3_DENNO|nr:hypothetical protein KFK09_026799 [Dendrobium nobile]
MAEALESSRESSPADETAIHMAPAEEDFAGDQTFTDAEASTVTEGNPQSTMQKHELEHSWTFWFDNPSGKSKQETWGSSIRPIYTFSTVEDFWGLYNNIQPPSKLPVGADFHCFKHGIEPKWEDPVCENGGKWTIICSSGDIDNWWLYTLLAMIGEQFDHWNEICGAVINVRAKPQKISIWKISIWTKNAFDEAAQDDAKKLDRNAKSRYFV